MTPIKKHFQLNGKLVVTVVDETGEATLASFFSAEEAIRDIQNLEGLNDVYL